MEVYDGQIYKRELCNFQLPVVLVWTYDTHLLLMYSFLKGSELLRSLHFSAESQGIFVIMQSQVMANKFVP